MGGVSGAVVGGAYGVVVSGIAAGRKRYGGRGCRALRAGRGRMRAGRVRVVYYPDSFGYIAISIVSNRRASFCVVVEKWLKRNKLISGILCEGRSEIVERAEDREIGFFTIGQGCVGVAVRRFYMVTRLYPLNKQRKRLLICNSRKMAKTEL